MKLVLDASIGIKWLLPEQDSPQAIAIRDGFRQQVHELIAPDTFAVEVAHALAEREQCQVVTADQRMVTLFPADVVSLSAL